MWSCVVNKQLLFLNSTVELALDDFLFNLFLLLMRVNFSKITLS